jgi:hypothetical protein
MLYWMVFGWLDRCRLAVDCSSNCHVSLAFIASLFVSATHLLLSTLIIYLSACTATLAEKHATLRQFLRFAMMLAVCLFFRIQKRHSFRTYFELQLVNDHKNINERGEILVLQKTGLSQTEVVNLRVGLKEYVFPAAWVLVWVELPRKSSPELIHLAFEGARVVGS